MIYSPYQKWIATALLGTRQKKSIFIKRGTASYKKLCLHIPHGIKDKWQSKITPLINLRMNSTSNDEGRFSDVPGIKAGGDKFIMVFTCKKCEERSAKYISKQAYNHGCVLIRCPGCKNLHLISDHMGVFEDPGWNIQKYLAANGTSAKVFDSENIFELNQSDILPAKSTLPGEK